MLKYYRLTNPSDVRDLADQMAAWEATGNPKAADWAAQPPAPSANAFWTENATWETPAAPTFTAEQHLDAVGLGGNRQPTLLYLRQAGAVSAKLDATEAFLNTVLGMFAQDPSPRSDWPAAPFSFEDVVGEAVGSLQSV